MSDTQFMLGKIIPADNTGAARDAVHIAVAPMVAGERLFPSQPVGLSVDGTVRSSGVPLMLGIVDPFLTTAVMPGDRFWLFLFPNTITSLRHEWTHPAFDVPVAMLPGTRIPDFVGASVINPVASQDWMEAFAKELGQDYDDLMTAASKWADRGQWTMDNSERYKKDGTWEKWPTFWRHFKTLTGKTPVGDGEDCPFTCAC